MKSYRSNRVDDMLVKEIEKLLKEALIDDGDMRHDLYKYELREHIPEWALSVINDKDDYLFAVTENNHDVAMLLIDNAGHTYVNESARDKLRTVWRGAYRNNMEKLIPMFATQLNDGEIPVYGVKTATTRTGCSTVTAASSAG